MGIYLDRTDVFRYTFCEIFQQLGEMLGGFETMQLFTPAECAANYVGIGQNKARMPLGKMFLLGILAGVFIALGGAVTLLTLSSTRGAWPWVYMS